MVNIVDLPEAATILHPLREVATILRLQEAATIHHTLREEATIQLLPEELIIQPLQGARSILPEGDTTKTVNNTPLISVLMTCILRMRGNLYQRTQTLVNEKDLKVQ